MGSCRVALALLVVAGCKGLWCRLPAEVVDRGQLPVDPRSRYALALQPMGPPVYRVHC